MSSISVYPTTSANAFTIAWTDDQVFIPHRHVPIGDIATLFPILTAWGCSEKQIRLVRFMIPRNMEGTIMREGTVDLRFELEGDPSEEELAEMAESEEAEGAQEGYPSDGEDEGQG